VKIAQLDGECPFDRMGLIWLLNGDRLLALTVDAAVIERLPDDTTRITGSGHSCGRIAVVEPRAARLDLFIPVDSQCS
jgi:hypothetical protein